MNLLKHVVLVATELNRLCVPVYIEELPPDALPIERADLGLPICEHDDLAVLHHKKAAGVAQQRLDRARQVVLSLTEPHDQRALAAGCDYGFRLPLADS